MKRLLCLFATALTLGGCASMITVPYQKPSLATPYQVQTTWTLRGGYSEKKLADDRYSVTFVGNGEVPSKAAEDFAIMHGAELCQAAGYEYVRMLSGKIFTDRIITNGISSFNPRAVAEIQCSHDAAGNAWLAAEIIARTQANYPLMYHPNRHSKASPAG